jgi:molecular chaperone GrpE
MKKNNEKMHTEEQEQQEEAQKNTEEQNKTETNQEQQSENGFETNENQEGELTEEEKEQAQETEEATGEETTEEEEQRGEEKEKSMEEKLTEISEKYMRLSAEFDNFRKRTLREKADLTKNAGENILKGLLPIMDDFERALETINNEEDEDAVKEGIKLIYNKFKDFLKEQGVTEIEALHTDFNTDVHEAVTKMPAPSEELKGKVVDVVQKGYFLNDKVLRYAKVVVGE